MLIYSCVDQDGGIAQAGSTSLAQLAVGLKPRYYFSGLEGMFYERQPYRYFFKLDY